MVLLPQSPLSKFGGFDANAPRFDLISNILKLSRGVPGYVAEVAWIALIDPLVPKVKLAPVVPPTLGMMFAPRRATARRNAFVPAELLAPMMSLVPAMSLAPATLLTPAAPLAPALLLVPAIS
jgi:hypothetical protein